MVSEDDGRNWSQAKEITSSVKCKNWTWYATGPCHGIQVMKGKYRGRMIIPCDHMEAETEKYFSHIIFSDDHGRTWQMGGTTTQDQVNECTVAEISGGRLLLNMRNYDRTKKSRMITLSNDGGVSWNDICPDPVLVEPICQASLLTYALRGKKPGILLFSNPANEENRINMTLRVSYNDGKSWPVSKVLHAGPSAYSDLVSLRSGDIGILYEAGEESPYEGIVFEVIPKKELINP